MLIVSIQHFNKPNTRCNRFARSASNCNNRNCKTPGSSNKDKLTPTSVSGNNRPPNNSSRYNRWPNQVPKRGASSVSKPIPATTTLSSANVQCPTPDVDGDTKCSAGLQPDQRSGSTPTNSTIASLLMPRRRIRPRVGFFFLMLKHPL